MNDLYYFLDVEVNLLKRSICKSGKKLKTSSLNFDLLVYFLNNPNKIINREELKQYVWIGRVVSDATVYKQILRLKQELLARLSNEEILQTVHGQGVKFVVEVNTIEPTEPANSDFKQVAHEKKSINLSPIVWVIIVGAVFFLSVLFFQVNKIKQNNSQLINKVERLAILYQTGEGSISTQVMAEVLQSQMLMSDNLHISLEEAQSQDLDFKKSSANLVQKLGYNHVLDMQVTTHEFGVKAHVLLRQGDEIYPMQQFEATSNHTLINIVSNWVLQKLQHDNAEKTVLSDITHSNEAFDFYLQATRHRFENKPKLIIALLNKAVSKDPDFSLALVALADEYRKQGKTLKALGVLDKINLSDASDRLNFKVLNSQAGCYYRLGQFTKSSETLEQALVLAFRLQDPDLIASVLTNQATLYIANGFLDKAKNNLEQALTHVDESYQKSFLAEIYSKLSSINSKSYAIDKALYYAELSYNTFIVADDERGANIILSNWANLLLHNAELEKAYDMALRVIKYSEYSSEVVIELYALQSTILIELELGRLSIAGTKLDMVSNKLSEVVNADTLLEYLKLRYQHYILIDELDAAFDTLQELHKLAGSVDDHIVKLNYAVLNVDFILKTEQQKVSENRISMLTGPIKDDAELWLVMAKIYAHNKQNLKAQLFFEKAMNKFQKQNQRFRLMKAIQTYLSFEKVNNIKSEQSQNWRAKLATLTVVDFLP